MSTTRMESLSRQLLAACHELEKSEGTGLGKEIEEINKMDLAAAVERAKNPLGSPHLQRYLAKAIEVQRLGEQVMAEMADTLGVSAADLARVGTEEWQRVATAAEARVGQLKSEALVRGRAVQE
jgi:hypothetical protein